MAHLDGDLWRFNLARVVWLDVSDDVLTMRDPMPNDCYPVLGEGWIPTAQLPLSFCGDAPVEGYLYDWHDEEEGVWYVGLVRASEIWEPARTLSR